MPPNYTHINVKLHDTIPHHYKRRTQIIVRRVMRTMYQNSAECKGPQAGISPKLASRDMLSEFKLADKT